MPNFLSAEELLGGLLPLGEPIVTGMFALVTVLLGWVFGRNKNKQEVENLRAEKRSIEAASGVSQAEAAQIISDAAVASVKPLLDRLKEYREENEELDDKILALKHENQQLKTHVARLESENELMRENFKLRGNKIPELPSEVKNHDGLR